MTTKLPSGIFENIPQKDIKNLLEGFQETNVTNVSDFFRGYIHDILTEENKKKISREDLNLMGGYTENLKEYANGLHKITKKQYKEDTNLNPMYYKDLYKDRKFSLQFIEKLASFADINALNRNENIQKTLKYSRGSNLEFIVSRYNIQTFEEFEKLCNNKHIRHRLKRSLEQNLKCAVIFCKDIEQFEKLCDNNDISRALENSIEESLQFVVNVLKLNTLQEFEELCDNRNMLYILQYSEQENLKFVVDLYKIQTLEQFKELFDSKEIRDAITSKEKVFGIIVNMYNIKTSEEFERLCSNKDLTRILRGSRIQNLELIISLFNIQTPEEFENLCFDSHISNILIKGKEKNLEFIISLFSIQTPEEFKKLCSNDNIRSALVDIGLSKNIHPLLNNVNISQEKLVGFLINLIQKSRKNTQILFQNKIPDIPEFQDIFAYFLKYKKKSLVDFIQKVSLSYEFNLGIDISKLKKIEDFNETAIQANFEKVLEIHGNSEKKKKKAKNQINNAIKFDDREALNRIAGENMIAYFDNVYHKKWRSRMKSEFSFDTEISDEKIDNPNFIEAYKMSIHPRYNKKQTQNLLKRYLSGDFDDISKLEQYNSPKNKKWLAEHLTIEQQKLWLSENKKIYYLNENDTGNSEETTEKNTEQRIQNHVEIACKKIEDINNLGFDFDTNFETSGELQKYFNMQIKKQEDVIKQNDADNFYEDLKLQIESIAKLKRKVHTTNKVKKTEGMYISRELDPLRSMMMGNGAQGSCLSFYSSVGNYWSAISNTIDVNKGVYYIYDQNNALLARFLLTIGEDKKLARYKIYYSKDVNIDMEKYVNEYVREMAYNMNIGLNGDEKTVKNIECDRWYMDGVVNM